ncbi:MAG: hypothetical protein PVH61_13830 [Candidatus Aminicenantes bacterium]|jgi:hypothetical protein
MKRIIIDFPESGPQEYTYSGSGRILKMSYFRRTISLFNPLENQKISITFDNSQGHWSQVLSGNDRYLKDREIQVFENDTLIGKIKVSDFPKPKSVHEFTIKGDMYSFLNNPISYRIGDVFENVPPENEGKRANVFCGTVTDEFWTNTGQLTAYQIEAGKYLAAWHHCFNISSVYQNGAPILYTWQNEGDGYCYIYPVEAIDDSEITFNGSGMMESSILIENAGEMLSKIKNDFGAGIEIEGILPTQYEKFKKTVVVLNDQTWKQAINEFNTNFDTFFYMSVNGKIKAVYLDFEGNIPVTKKFLPGVISGYELHPDISSLLTEAERNYCFHFQNNSYRYSHTSKIETGWTADTKPIDLRFHTDSLSAHTTVCQKIFRQRDIIKHISFKTIRDELPQVDLLGQLFSLTYSYGLSKNENRTYLCIEIAHSGANEYSIRGIDIYPLIKNTIILLSESDPDVAILTNKTDPECLLLM